MASKSILRQLPSVDQILKDSRCKNLIGEFGRNPTVYAIRQMLEEKRSALLAGDVSQVDVQNILYGVQVLLEESQQPSLRSVINATGVIIHTNLGRAVLSKSAQQAMLDVGGQYNTLEFDLETGKRGSRLVHAQDALCDLTHAEAAMVVNNAASALVLILSAFAKEREVILSRGQLVEIGGGFRIPEIMQQSSAQLVEVGTTNRTRIQDYKSAITDATAMLMRVHSSNFKQIGFVEQATLSEIATLAHEHNLLMLDDLGSGALINTEQFGLAHEPTVQESIQSGADLVVFSGDKLLGGPQAGIIVGKRDLIDRLKQHPLARALRMDKLGYAALCATLQHYWLDEAIEQIPVWQMISRPLESIRQVANEWAERIGASVVDGESAVGGGTLPGTTLPTALLAVTVESPDLFMTRLRNARIPIIARVQNDQVLFDPRTILPEQESIFIDTLDQLLK